MGLSMSSRRATASVTALATAMFSDSGARPAATMRSESGIMMAQKRIAPNTSQ